MSETGAASRAGARRDGKPLAQCTKIAGKMRAVRQWAGRDFLARARHGAPVGVGPRGRSDLGDARDLPKPPARRKL